MSRLRIMLALLVLPIVLLATGAEAAVVYLKARLDGPQANVTTTADGAGFMSYDTDTRLLTWTVTFRNLSSTLVAAHFHGPAARGADAGIQVPINVAASPLTGSATLTPTQAADMLAGLYYVNLHTSNFPNGEIRGQLEKVTTFSYTATLDGAQAGTPGSPIPTSGTGTAAITFDPSSLQMSWNISYSGLTSQVVAAHFHGPATPFEPAGIVVPTGTDSPITGSTLLNAASAAEFVNGFWYHNIHTSNFPNGEIRGQVLAENAHLGAISTRLQVLTGDNVMIAGFNIGGTSPKKVLIRASGPSLVARGVAGAMADPTLTVVPAAGGAALTNDDWQTHPSAAELTSSGLAPSDPHESAMLVTLNPGAYTGIVAGKNNSTGVAIVEVFEVDHRENPITAISTRGFVQTGDNVIIGGIFVSGASQTLVVRGRGPSLAAQGVSNLLANPTLQLFDNNAGGNTLIASNDDWQTAANSADLAASGFAPSDSREAALLITLSPGIYTAIVSGSGGSTGVGIVEVFSVP